MEPMEVNCCSLVVKYFWWGCLRPLACCSRGQLPTPAPSAIGGQAAVIGLPDMHYPTAFLLPPREWSGAL